MSDPNTGRLIGNRYQLQELIGTGAMGRVYRAKDILLGGVPVAIKFLAISMQNEKMRLHDRFEREAKTCALLGQKSIHIVRVMDYGIDEYDTPYYVMEYLQGNNLSDIIRNQNLSLTRFLSMARQICLGLECAHNGIPVDGSVYPIIHRDIKPSNMLVVQDSSFGELVKVLDFGIAKLIMSDSDQTKFYLGTLAYSSPEQIEGKELDKRSDIYSLGVMMFEMLTAKLPLIPPNHSFGAWYQIHKSQKPSSFAEVNPTLQVPKPVEDLVMSCLEKKPKNRPQNISAILSILVSAEQQNKILKKASENIPASNPSLTIENRTEPEKKTVIEKLIHPVTEKTIKTELRVFPISDEISRTTSWPVNKPIADIVFPQPIPHDGEVLAALWVMLPEQEIQKRLVCTRYNQFLFISLPHPMLLWITVIYNREHGARWLPYYLDLKTNFGQEIVRLLQHTGHYRLLFFSRETPSRCNHVLSSSIDPIQCERLQEWLQISRISTLSADAQMSKAFLKQEYEKIKPQILAKLEKMDTDSPFDLSG